MKVNILYFNPTCAEVVRRDYRKYSVLSADFILGGRVDEQFRAKVIGILSKHLEEIGSPRIFKHYLENPLEGQIIPFISHGYKFLVIGNSLVSMRLPREVVDKIVREDGFVELVRERCASRHGIWRGNLT